MNGTDLPGRDIHVCTSFDARMIVPVGVLAQSLWESAPADRRIILHLLHGPDVDASAMHRVLPPTDRRFTFRLHCVDEADLAGIPLALFPKAAFYRLLIDDHLDVGRVVFLDADTLVLTNIGGLHDLDLQGHPIAAMQDFVITDLWPAGEAEFAGRTVQYRRYVEDALGFADANGYVNSGVMVIDLGEWRRRGIRQRCLDYCRGMPALVFADQDAINWCLRGDVLKLDPRWNALVNFSGRLRDPATTIERVCDAWHRQPWIAHFAGFAKPWKPNPRLTPHERKYRAVAARSACAGRFRSDYRRAVDALPWRQRLHLHSLPVRYRMQQVRSLAATAAYRLKLRIAARG